MKKFFNILLICTMLSGCGAKSQNEEITLLLDYVPNTNHTGIYVALEKGYYTEAGLDLEILEPTGTPTATLVANGNVDFGISYQEDVTIARASKEPLPIKAISAILQHNTSGLASYAEKNITSPKDFEGKTYSGWGGAGEEAALKAIMNKNGADFSKVEIIMSDGSGMEVLSGDVDLMWFFEGWDVVLAEMNDFPINYIELRKLDERLDYYTPLIITSDNLIETNSDKVSAFISATQKGYTFAAEHPQESVEILHKYAPENSIEMLQKSQEYLSAKYIDDAEVWGIMKDSVWENYTNFLKEYDIINSDINPSECFTNEFILE